MQYILYEIYVPGGPCVIYDWLVVLTILKNISQWQGLSHI
jgi:hypothetical protein